MVALEPYAPGENRERRRKEDADERVSWSSYLHVAGIALVIMVCTVELVGWLLARGS